MKAKMPLSGQDKNRRNVMINCIESTAECMTGRAGLPFIMKYIENTDVLSRLDYKFQYLKNQYQGIKCSLIL